MSRLKFIQNKIQPLENALRIIDSWRLKNDKIVFTNGCFDILHQGHVVYLAKAAEFGHRLIVGINDDASVKAQGKGEERPINNESSRQLLIAALEFVDLVILFNESTPYNLINSLKPDILIKGADYDPNETDSNSPKYIVGSDIVKKNNGLVEVINLEEGFSTTNIISKIKK